MNSLTLLAGIFAATAPTAFAGSDTTTIADKIGGNVTISTSWTWSGSDISVKLDVTSKENQVPMWIGVGWNPTGDMVGADFVMGYVAGNGDVCVRPLFCENHPPPTAKPLLHISNGVFQKANNITTLSFTRPAASGNVPLNSTFDMTTLLAGATLGLAKSGTPPANCTSVLTMDQVHDFYVTERNITYSS
eukprot:TRINITY_DN35406_c0_g1_i1.p1 TRINITY_DN35406_c0_g1~~TRINITY_DN35406_c0_g1_i1.p1  ORF type:complete len:190 (+),score=43.78 TRINITY_DN35406_c0_g1_i1:60-629(+)